MLYISPSDVLQVDAPLVTYLRVKCTRLSDGGTQ